MGIDPVTGKFKGFAILTYNTAEGCKKALEEPTKVFEGCQLQCRLSVEGQRGIKNQTGGPAPLLQQSDLAALNYGVGLSAGFYGHTMNPATLLLAQNPGIGLANPMLVSRLSPSVGAATSLGFGGSGSYGVNTVSPSVIGSYGSQAALQGLGAYQSAQLRNSPAASTGSVAGRSQSGFGSAGTTFPAFYGP
ncbi:hypothetical protein RJ639_030382 [Escallonia herrerae]|uniref:RRM domain-containing protein n=1 Tax=Escallonia herrerae TaxID=1293975 RepID=A0AA89BLQ8_9ASTE|nr:hypothetical protein RJ639_030382 [Escallonia herrerae]